MDPALLKKLLWEHQGCLRTIAVEAGTNRMRVWRLVQRFGLAKDLERVQAHAAQRFRLNPVAPRKRFMPKAAQSAKVRHNERSDGFSGS